MFGTLKSLLFFWVVIFAACVSVRAVPVQVSTLTINGNSFYHDGTNPNTPYTNAQLYVTIKFYVGGVLKFNGGAMPSGAAWQVSVPCYKDIDGPGASYFEVIATVAGGGGGSTGGGVNCSEPPAYEIITRSDSGVAYISGLNSGPTSCNASLGRPVNVTNGNMWLQQIDYVLPGVGESISLNRTYNSAIQETGLFGVGWKTDYDAMLTNPATNVLALKSGNGRSVYFGSPESSVFPSLSNDIPGKVTANGDSTYTITFKDGRTQKFDSTGKLLWLKDRNGNQTTLNYTSGVLTSVTDAVGRTLSFTYGGNGAVSEISDSTGTIAEYEYYTGTSKLKTVTYPDGSKYKFEYTTVTIGGVSHILLTTVKDALDNVLEDHTYDSSGRALTSEVDGGVETYTFDYSHIDDSSPYTTITDGLSRVSKYYFDKSQGKNLITKTEGLCGCGGSGTESVVYEYDNWLNLVKKTDALSNESTYTYDSNSNLTSITDSVGTQTFTYNAYGDVLVHTDPMGGGSTKSYDSNGNLLTVRDAVPIPTITPVAITWTNKAGVSESPTGTITRNTGTDSWGASGASSVESITGDGTLKYVVGQTDKHRMIGLGYVDSNQSYTDIDFAINITADGYTTIYQNGLYIQFFYGYSTGTVLEIERIGTSIKYKKDGTVLYTQTGVSPDPLFVDTSIYSDAGTLSGLTLMTPITLYPGNTTTMTYTSEGLIETIEDARGKTTEFDYDSAKRLVKITDANAKETDFTYNARAKVTSVTNALNQTTSFDYDAKDRLETITYPDTSEVNFDYDLAGRKTAVTDELGHATTYAYDDAYRLTSITDALSHSTSFGYDAMSNLTSQTDALGNVTSIEYNDFNRVKKVIYPAPSPSATPLQETMTYDKNGNVKTKVDTGGRTTSYDYDDANRLTKITDALSNETQFTYNARSQMTKVKDALNQEYTFTYDPQGRVLTQTRNSQTMTFTYDAVGNRATRTDYLGHVTSYTYDDLNRLTNVGYTGASGENASYTYDDLSRLLTAVNAAGTVTFTYDNRGRLKTEEDVFGHDLEYTYDAAGRRTGLELDSTPHTSYAYDNANRLNTLTDEASNDFTFAYDNANRLTSRVMPNGVTSTYTYDNMSRLKRLKHENTSTTLYDDQFTYNTANQISQIAGLAATKNYTYDNINRLTAVTVGGSTVESYTYDAVGNRTASHLSSSYTTGAFNRVTATDSATYTYNANGSTTGKTVGSTSWAYGWDRENRMTSAGDGTNSASYQYDAFGRRTKRSQGAIIEKYTHDELDIILDDTNATITKYQNDLGIDSKLKLVTGSTSKYFLESDLGSTNGVAGSTGNVLDTNSYDSFGEASNATFSNRYQYTGREQDSLSGLQFSRARLYDSELGRFVSEDPIGFNGGDINLYGYVKNNPINFTDPMGLDGVFRNGNDLADWWDARIRTASDFWGDFPIGWNPVWGTTTFWGGIGGAGDMFRCGYATGQASSANGENIYGYAAYGAMDIARCSALFAAMAGPASRLVPRSVPVVQGEVCPTRSFNPFKGKTPAEIDAMMRAKGYTPKGPDPMNGAGNYINPRTKRGYHVDANHPPPKPPHVGVHRSRGKRGSMGPREFPL